MKRKHRRAEKGGGVVGSVGGTISANYKLFLYPLLALLGVGVVVGVVIVFFMWSAGMGTPWQKVELDRLGKIADGADRSHPNNSSANPEIRGKAVVLRRVLTVGPDKAWEFSPLHGNLAGGLRGKSDDPVLTLFLIEFTGMAELGPPTQATVVAYREGTAVRTVASRTFATTDGRSVEEQIGKWLLALPRK